MGPWVRGHLVNGTPSFAASLQDSAWIIVELTGHAAFVVLTFSLMCALCCLSSVSSPVQRLLLLMLMLMLMEAARMRNDFAARVRCVDSWLRMLLQIYCHRRPAAISCIAQAIFLLRCNGSYRVPALDRNFTIESAARLGFLRFVLSRRF